MLVGIPRDRGLHGEKTGKAMKKYKFKAKIEAGNGGGAYVLFPFRTILGRNSPPMGRCL
jgi:hypothetical protein